MIDTKISWAHATWNPWTGCDKVSKECVGCYADALLTRTGRTFNILALTQTWKTPYQLNALAKAQGRQAICFVCSLSDFFHADADRWRRDAWRIIHDCKNVNFMLLTKRPERITACLPGDWNDGKNYPNAWLGTTCGARSSYARLDALRSIPCALRFVSVEPLMESVADIDLAGIGWVAVGGMSGALHAKHKMQMAWAAEVHDVCRRHEVPFLFKQASHIHTERGINALSLYLAEREGKVEDPATVPVIREYPPTDVPLLPFTEHGKRFSAEDWKKYSGVQPKGHRKHGTSVSAAALSDAIIPTPPSTTSISSPTATSQSSKPLRPAGRIQIESENDRPSASTVKKCSRVVASSRSIGDSVRMVQGVYPQSIAEWPSQSCSISEFPGGPEVSQRFVTAALAWRDAARTIIERAAMG